MRFASVRTITSPFCAARKPHQELFAESPLRLFAHAVPRASVVDLARPRRRSWFIRVHWHRRHRLPSWCARRAAQQLELVLQLRDLSTELYELACDLGRGCVVRANRVRSPGAPKLED